MITMGWAGICRQRRIGNGKRDIFQSASAGRVRDGGHVEPISSQNEPGAPLDCRWKDRGSSVCICGYWIPCAG